MNEHLFCGCTIDFQTAIAHSRRIGTFLFMPHHALNSLSHHCHCSVLEVLFSLLSRKILPLSVAAHNSLANFIHSLSLDPPAFPLARVQPCHCANK